jgi:hypothetical protein
MTENGHKRLAPPQPCVSGSFLSLCVSARLSVQAICNERRKRVTGRVSPADAERMSRRVRVHLVTLGGIEIRSGLQQPGAQADCLLVRGARVIDVKVEMHLLWRSMRPARRNVARR